MTVFFIAFRKEESKETLRNYGFNNIKAAVIAQVIGMHPTHSLTVADEMAEGCAKLFFVFSAKDSVNRRNLLAKMNDPR